MIHTYEQTSVFIRGFDYQLGANRRTLADLEARQRIAGSIEILRSVGYEYNHTLGEEEDLVSLAAGSLSRSLARCSHPIALVFQHCYSDSVVSSAEIGNRDLASRSRYLQPAVMKKAGLDEVPYFCSFASGCAGFLFALTYALGLIKGSLGSSVICILADAAPADAAVDMVKEAILESDHSSAFLVDVHEGDYQILGINHYSTARASMPLLELVNKTVEMIEGLAAKLGIGLRKADVTIHYPNIFPKVWTLVTRQLRIPDVTHLMEGLAERAHCGGSDSVISLSNHCGGREGQIHLVVNYGAGLHLAVGLFRSASGSAFES